MTSPRISGWVIAWCCSMWCLTVQGATTASNAAVNHTVVEFQEGTTATLPCPSNDDNHRFLFWELENDTVIGPANPADRNKYKYEVLSGDLYVKHVTSRDAGHYKCVSMGLKKPSFSIQPVDLVVKRDWELLWESDTSINLLRGVLAMFIIAVVCGIAIVLLKMRRSGYVKGDDLSDDDMPEDIGDGPYHTTTQRGSPDNLSLVDTELPRALNSMYTDRL